MLKLLEKIFHTIIPHEKNNNVPHILHETSISFLFFFVLALFMLSSRNMEILRGLGMTATVYPAVITDLTNEARAEQGLGTLKWSPLLASAAELKAKDMITNGYFAHTSPAGVSPWHWLSELKYNFHYAGENLAIRFNESQAVQNAWLNSPTHKANIMNSKFSEIGIATVDGMYQGRETTFVVEYFGSPYVAPAVTIPTPSVPVKAPTTTPTKNNTLTPKVNPSKVATITPKPAVAGAEVEVAPTNVLEIKTLEENPKFVVVENISPRAPTDLARNMQNVVNETTWYQRLIVNPNDALRGVYYAIIGAILTAMAFMLFKEYRDHHMKHFALGLGMVAVLLVLIQFIPNTVFIA